MEVGTAALCALAIAACGGSKADTVSTPPGSAGASGAALGAAAKVAGADWQRFDFDAQRSGVGPSDTGITAGNVGTLGRRRVHLDGTVDSSPVELHGVRVGGRVRDVVFVTTTYGRTIAIDPGTGAKLWEFVPPDIRHYQGTYQITTATPVDRSRPAGICMRVDPGGHIHKLAVATGRQVRTGHWPVRVTFLPSREKIASALNISGNSVIATTGGYIGDAPPYVGHVVMIDRASGRITRGLELAVRRPPPPPASELVSADAVGDLGSLGRGGRAGHPSAARRHRQRSVQREHGVGRQRARAQPRRPSAAPGVDAERPGSARGQRHRPREHRAGDPAAAPAVAGSPSRAARPASST